MTDPTSLIDLFSPPPDHIGDFGLICGFTAGRDTIERIKRRFSADVSHPKLALLIHPTTAPVTDVPGVIWCHIDPDSRARGFGLLHAKLALVGFRERGTGAYRVRLVVSTGNWTHEPLSTSIDCFWKRDAGAEDATAEDGADMRRARESFALLRAHADDGLLARPFDGHLPDAALNAAIDAMPFEQGVDGLLIDNRENGLIYEFISRLPQPSRRRKATRVVMGAGYYQGDSRTKFVPRRIWKKLVKAGLLEEDCESPLVANPDACQSLVARAAWLKEDGWPVYAPRFPNHRRGEPASPRKLHAKFILLGGDDLTRSPASLYLGSGNLTGPGLMDAMSPKGNLEAGVVIRPDPPLPWRGRLKRPGLSDLLPIARWVERLEPIDLDTAAAGPDFERPEEPDTLPQVSWLVWTKGVLAAPEGAAVAVRRPDGTVGTTPCDWPAPCPYFVTLDDSAIAVPVLSDGVLATRPRPRSFDEILMGLRQFPEPTETGDDPDVEEEASGFSLPPPNGPAGMAPGAETPDRPYPVRRMMRLLVALTGRQTSVIAYDWDRWCRELQSDLSGIAAAEEPTIAFFRMSGADPLPILLDPRFLPDGVEVERLAAALKAIRGAWGLDGCLSLWEEEEPTWV